MVAWLGARSPSCGAISFFFFFSTSRLAASIELMFVVDIGVSIPVQTHLLTMTRRVLHQ